MIFHGEPISGRSILFLISKIIFVSSTHIYIYIRKEKIFRVKNNLVRFYTLVSGSPNPVPNQEFVEVGPCIELNKCWTWTLNPAVSTNPSENHCWITAPQGHHYTFSCSHTRGGGFLPIMQGWDHDIKPDIWNISQGQLIWWSIFRSHVSIQNIQSEHNGERFSGSILAKFIDLHLEPHVLRQTAFIQLFPTPLSGKTKVSSIEMWWIRHQQNLHTSTCIPMKSGRTSDGTS